MERLQNDRLQMHVDAAIREILVNYENGLGSFCQAPLDAAGELAFELSAVIETLPQARLRQRLLAEVQHLLRDPILPARGPGSLGRPASVVRDD